MPRIAGHISAPPTPHQDPGRDQPGLGLGGAAERRHRGEDRGAEEEGPAAPEHVGEAAAGDDQDAEGQRVGVDHPLHRVDVGVEVLLHRRDGDVDRREVVGDDDHADPHRERASQVERVDRGADSIACDARAAYAKLERPNDAPARQPRASPSPPPSGGIALGGAIAAREKVIRMKREGGGPSGTSRRRKPRPHLRHHPARRRAVARHLAEHRREGRDRPAARPPGRRRDRGRLPDHLAR